MTKSVPVAANNTAKAKYKYGKNFKIVDEELDNLTGRNKKTSCIAPKGQTPAQNVRPKKKVKINGIIKKANTVAGIVYSLFSKAKDTFCKEPTEQTQPFLKKPK